jgi:HlyD family secretion protein
VRAAEQSREAASQRVAQARAQLAGAVDTLQKTTIVSPLDGIVSRLRVREGEMVVVGIQNQGGTTLMTVSDLGAVNAEVKVAEADVLQIAVGQPAQVTLEAIAGRSFSGRVIEIGASALPVSGTGAAAREFRVVVRLDRPDPGLRPGLTCDTEIVTSEHANVLTVPLQAVVLRRPGGAADERAGLMVVQNGRSRFTPVTTGIIGGLDIEVTGISEGSPVVMGPFQALRELTDGAPVRQAGR